MLSDGRSIHNDLLSEHPEIANYLMGADAVREYKTLPNHSYSGPLIESIRGRVALRLDVDLCDHWPDGYFDAFMQIINRNSFRVVLKTGDGYILDNRRMLHGR